MAKRKAERGQGIVEFALILPVLLILMLGVVEIGYALRNYLIVVNACREGGRIAARGRFDDDVVIERVVSAGGRVNLGDLGTDLPFLRTDTYGPDPNTAVVVTHIRMDEDGFVDQQVVPTCDPASLSDPIVSVCISGTLPITGGVRPALAADSRISVTEVIQRHSSTTQDINATREAANFGRQGNHVVVVEVIFMHHPLWNNPLLPLPDPWMMHARSEMRVTGDRER